MKEPLGPEWDGLRSWLFQLRKVTQARLKHRRRTGKKPWPITDQLCHMHSEVTEVYEAYRSCEGLEHRLWMMKRHFLEELSDCIYSAFTTAHLLKFTDEEILEGLIATLRKIQGRARELE